MMNMNRRQLLAGMGSLAAASVISLPARAQSKTLVVPTLGGAWEQFWRSTLAPAFTAKSGAAVTLDAGNGRVWSANLRAAGAENPPYSILMTNEAFASSLRKQGFFEKLDLTRGFAFQVLLIAVVQKSVEDFGTGERETNFLGKTEGGAEEGFDFHWAAG